MSFGLARKTAGYIDDFLNSQWLSVNQKIVGININASVRWFTKSWPLARVIKLCEELAQRDIRVIVTGTQDDLSQADTLMNTLKNVPIINACGKTTVNQLACLIKRCNVYISGDSAPLHIAVSMDTPFVALFGPTDPARHLAPAKDYILIKKDLPCSPCYKSKCKTKKCMKLITAGRSAGGNRETFRNEYFISYQSFEYRRYYQLCFIFSWRP